MFWITLIVVVLGLVINMTVYWMGKQETERAVRAQIEEKLNLQTKFVNRWTQERLSDLWSLAGSDRVKSLDKSSIGSELERFYINQNDFSEISFVNREGIVVNGTAIPYWSDDIKDTLYFQAGMSGKEYVSGVVLEPTEPVILLAVPILTDWGEANGVVIGKVKLDTIHDILQSVHLRGMGEQYVLDRDGMFITKLSPDQQKGFRAESNLSIVKQAKSDQEERSVYINYKGDAVFGAYQWTEDRRWIVVAEMERIAVLGPLYNSVFVIVVITLFVLTISLYGIIVVTRRMEVPLAFLLQGTKVIKEGQYDYWINRSVFKYAPIELRELCDTFNLMSRKLRSTVQLLEEHARIDALTELHNRRYMQQEGMHLVDACLKLHQPCSLLMIDVDHFKKVNDSFGHSTGDRVLHYVADILKQTMRQGDLLARYGGEEFILLLPKIGLEEAMRQGEAIRRQVEAAPYSDEGVLIPLTVSIGAASIEASWEAGEDRGFYELADAADRALYMAKELGRNRVEVIRGEG
ncbi:diguanylate cyclase [Paenibacillus sp. NPDC056579]|uniref:sensor domain-containing diguanylate cyclase n=1 Tax=Paenibacillus sp. NPDC056579 TaxID=3345871 RepID=UPI0036B6A5FA